MEKDQIIILENRGLISITGDDAKEYLQNIITNDINKVTKINSIFAALLSPQGKYLFDFFVIKDDEGYLLDCDGNSVKELVVNLSKLITPITNSLDKSFISTSDLSLYLERLFNNSSVTLLSQSK